MQSRLGSLCVCLTVGAIALAGCGSSSNNQRTALIHKITSQMSGAPSDLRSCVGQKASGLPTSQLRALASSANQLSGSNKQAGIRLIVDCIREGHGADLIRSQISQKFTTAFPSSLPASFRSCVQAKVQTLPSSQLADLLSVYANLGQAAGHAQAEAAGRTLAVQCLTQPKVIVSLRGIFLSKFQSLAQNSQYSEAFRKCVMGKAAQISSQQLLHFALHPSEASAAGYKIGRGYAEACIAQGARP